MAELSWTRFLYIKEDDLLVAAPDKEVLESQARAFGSALLLKPTELRQAMQGRTSQASVSSLMKPRPRAQTPGFQPRPKFKFRSPARSPVPFDLGFRSIRCLERPKSRLQRHPGVKFTADNQLLTIDSTKREEALIQQHTQTARDLTECRHTVAHCKQELIALQARCQQLKSRFRTELLHSHQREQELAQRLRTARLQGKKTAVENQIFLEKARNQHQTRAHFRDLQKQVDQASEAVAAQEQLLVHLQQAKAAAKTTASNAREALRQFYYKVLKQGSDTRESGLRWAIRALWAFDEPVPVSMFSKCLADDTICFLFEVAVHEWRLAKYEARLTDLRHRVSLEKSHLNRSNQELLADVRRRLFKITKAVVASPVTRTVTPQAGRSRRRNEALERCVEADELRDKIVHLKREINRLSLKEVKQEHNIQVLRCLFGQRLDQYMNDL